MAETVDFYHPSLYINRELSWLEFNRRCLTEAEDKTNPLLSRVKFLAIAYGNMDEFFMIRVPGMLGGSVDSALNLGPDSFEDQDEFITAVTNKVSRLVEAYDVCWSSLNKELWEKNIRIRTLDSLNENQRAWINEYFRERVYALLTPLALDVSHPFPFISNNSLNLAVKIKRGDSEFLYARIKVPTTILPRFVKISSDTEGAEGVDLICLEDIVKANISMLFPGLEVIGVYNFRVTRNADVKVTIDEACDLMAAVETSLDSRDMGFPVRMMVEEDMPASIISLFGKNLKLKDNQIHKVSVGGMLLTDLWEIAGLNFPKLKDKPMTPYCPPEFSEEACIFDTIKEKDWILFHPFESFDAVVNFIKEAANDPLVQSIKICLYRIGKDPAIIRALMKARDKGKTVSVLMELRAKFDETNNILLARELEKMGIHVVYGPVDLKVHSKLLQVVRLEGEHLVRYTHLSSGNYNTSSAKQYCDISFLTANQEIGNDVGELFNALTGYFGPREYKHLLVAPLTLKSSLIEKIRREVDHKMSGKEAYIVMKANGLVDSDIIAELYKASVAGVKVELNIRGLCCLRPGVPGVSDNIRVTCVVDRFLEHSRIYYFLNGGEQEMYMGSSDLMPRNLMVRVEALFPVLDKDLLVLIRDNIMNVHLADNVKARMLLPNGEYIMVPRPAKAKKVHSQRWFLENRGVWHGQR